MGVLTVRCMSGGDKGHEEKEVESTGSGSRYGCNLNRLPEGKARLKSNI